MDQETVNRIRAQVADAKARIASLEADVQSAKQVGIITIDMERSLEQAKAQIAQVERVYGVY